MKIEAFIDQLLAQAKADGIETAEVYYTLRDSFVASAMDGEINQYQVSSSSGLGLRGTVMGRMGYASTQAYDEEAIRQLIEGVKDSAALTEGDHQDEIFVGEESYPTLPELPSDLDMVTPEQKLQLCLQMEQAAKAADARISKVRAARISTGKSLTRIKNSFGLDLVSRDCGISAMVFAIAREKDDTATGGKLTATRNFADLDALSIGRAAAEDTVSQLGASSVPSGTYRVIIHHDAMSDLLHTFCGMFSAENAQQKLSLLAGKEGTHIASECVTLMDDPLLPGGNASRVFDDEGSASRTKAVIDRGVLTTLLHDRKTARAQGVQTTGNASRASYSAPVHVSPTNLFFTPGSKTLDDMMADMQNGLVITEVSGLHSGANPTSGDFSLLSSGYLVKDGKRSQPVKQITIAGNFYQLLQSIRQVGSDLAFDGRSIASPSLDVGTLAVSGK